MVTVTVPRIGAVAVKSRNVLLIKALWKALA